MILTIINAVLLVILIILMFRRESTRRKFEETLQACVQGMVFEPYIKEAVCKAIRREVELAGRVEVEVEKQVSDISSWYFTEEKKLEILNMFDEVSIVRRALEIEAEKLNNTKEHSC